MGSISFPDVREDMHSKDGYLTWVLYHPGKNQFFGFVSLTVCYGWTNEPVVTCMGSSSVSPITERYAQCLLSEARHYRRWDDDMLALEVRRVRMIPNPEDRNRYSWRFE
jgi:hypothetical protein